MNTEDFSDLTIKLASATKSKRLGRTPKTYQDLSMTVETLIREERNPSDKKDYAIKYQDGDSDLINVSDDEDLQVAYKVARKELGGVLKFSIAVKAAAPVEKVDEAKLKARKALKEEKKKLKETKKKLKERLVKASLANKAELHQQVIQQVDGVAGTLKAKLGQLTQAIG